MPFPEVDCIDRYGYKSYFIETGSFVGNTVQKVQDLGFKEIHTIELMPNLYKGICEKFTGKTHIHPWLGSSVDILPRLIADINEPVTFWLDAHENGFGADKCPLVKELKIIKEHPIKTHTIFVDDMRVFKNPAHWGVGVEGIKQLIKEINPEYKFVYLDCNWKDDVLCAHVKE